MYSFSTCWNSHRHDDGRAMLREIAELGFEYAELSHGIRVSLVPGIVDAVEAGEIKISTLHNFCPLPLGVNHAAPNIYEFSSEDRREREYAWKHTLKTIEFAVRVKAKLIVIHSGSMEFRPSFFAGLFGAQTEKFTDKILDLVAADKSGSEEFNELVTQAIARQEACKTGPLERSLEILNRIAVKAAEHDLLLGIENREALEEIPLDQEMWMFLDELPSETVRYWHDCGHGQIKANLGFIDHTMHVQSLAHRLGGFHVHDVAFPGKDHQPPGSGMIDFEALGKLVKPDHIKVFEMNPALSKEEVLTGVKHLKSVWGES
jgi:sugar phosphate isomerase/epimerase